MESVWQTVLTVVWDISRRIHGRQRSTTEQHPMPQDSFNQHQQQVSSGRETGGRRGRQEMERGRLLWVWNRAYIKAMGKHKASENCTRPHAGRKHGSPKLRHMVHHTRHQPTLPGVKGRLSWGPRKALHPLGTSRGSVHLQHLGRPLFPSGLHILALKPNSTGDV